MKRNQRTVFGCLLFCLALLCLTGCGSPGREFEPNGNGMYVSSEGKISTAFEVEVDQSYFSEADMKSFCETEVKEYNRSKGASGVAYQEEAAEEEVLPVAIKSFTYGQKALLVLDYASPEDYLAFNKKDEARAGSVMYAAAKNTTGLPDMKFLSVEDGSQVTADSIIGDGKLKIVMIEGEQNVQVQGKLVYYSDNVTVTGEDTAVTASEGYSYLIFR